jgi:BirA family transcriptional regulator, biotin operon repressor / biotin---[acetyl-CoA-carboxylase] ligase
MNRFLARSLRFPLVGSTNDVVREWLADGTPEVCLAIADEQTAGRGRDGRTWTAPRGVALLLSLGFRPTWLAPELAWRLAAVVSLAMAEAAESVAAVPEGTIRLKWPNDLVVEPPGSTVGKLAGVLGETTGLGTGDPRVIIGLGINADWAAADFPAELAGTMTSLREVSHGRPVDRTALAAAFVDRLQTRVGSLRGGRFDGAAWADRQLTTGRVIRIDQPDGTAWTGQATGVDATSGALIVEDVNEPDGTRRVLVGEVGHVRLATPATSAV